MRDRLLHYADSYATSQDIDEYFVQSPEGQVYNRFRQNGCCPYCNVPTKRVLYGRTESDPCDYTRDEFNEICLRACLSCGWWYDHFAYVDRVYMDSTKITRSLRILRKFEVCSPALPIECLASELVRRPGVLHEISPKRLETFVAAVLQDFYDVEVSVVGRTADGGIDLVYVQSEKPFAVQVKRRQSSDSKETVELVRAFLGACLLAERRNAAIVTTAADFTAPARAAAKRAVRLGLLETFDLVAREKFLELFHYTSLANL
jgi:hypothetical protein